MLSLSVLALLHRISLLPRFLLYLSGPSHLDFLFLPFQGFLLLPSLLPLFIVTAVANTAYVVVLWFSGVVRLFVAFEVDAFEVETFEVEVW